jgi:hypothetical protein
MQTTDENSVFVWYDRYRVRRDVVTLCTTKFNVQKFYVMPTECIMYFIWISEQAAIIPQYIIN